MAMQQFIINVDIVVTQDRQCTSKVTLRRVRATIAAKEKQCLTYSECVFLEYIVHALCCHM